MENWSVAISMMFPTEAHMVQGYLQSEGIETIMKNEMITQVYNLYSNAVGGVEILVKNEDLERAIQLLEKGGYIKHEKPQIIEKVKLEKGTIKTQCPFCQSENIGKAKSPDYFMLVASLLLGTIIPILRRSNKCFDCGKEWKFEK